MVAFRVLSLQNLELFKPATSVTLVATVAECRDLDRRSCCNFHNRRTSPYVRCVLVCIDQS